MLPQAAGGVGRGGCRAKRNRQTITATHPAPLTSNQLLSMATAELLDRESSNHTSFLACLTLFVRVSAGFTLLNLTLGYTSTFHCQHFLFFFPEVRQ